MEIARTISCRKPTPAHCEVATAFRLQQFGIKPWLLRIMYNLHLNRADREKREPQAVEDDALEASSRSDETVLPIDPTSFQAMDQQLVPRSTICRKIIGLSFCSGRWKSCRTRRSPRRWKSPSAQ